jgi:hypothetical protein
MAVLAVENMYGYALLPKGEQQTLVKEKEWIKYGDTISDAYRRGDKRKRAVFLLPGTNHLICRDALCRLLGIGREAWTTIFKMAKNNTPPSHGLEERIFKTCLLLLATPRATLVIRSLVRDQVETELQDDDKDIVELPSHMTKRSLYDRMLLQIGWKYVFDAKSRIVEQQPVEGIEQERAPAWSSFQRYWAKHHPKLFIAGAREDVCNQCYIFANRHRYVARMKQAAEEEDEAKGNDDKEQQQQQQGPPAADDDNEDEEEARMLRGK